MGEFAKSVRHNKIAGPNQRNFNRQKWEDLLNDASIDEDDQRILHAGLFFDELFCFLRKDKKLSNIPLPPFDTIRLIIALSTFHFFQISKQTELPLPSSKETRDLYMSEVMEKKVQVFTGEFFSPDELLSGIGDGMKHMLRELLSQSNHFDIDDKYSIGVESVAQVNLELNKAVIYQCAVEYWHDCVGNTYGLIKHEQGLALAPFNRAMEIARTVSTYRRHSIALQDIEVVLDRWFHSWSRRHKEMLCEIPLVIGIKGQDRIEHIDVGMNNKVLNNASSSVAAKLWIQHGYYEFLLDEPLPKFSNFTLNQIISGWRVLQSLAVAIFDSLKPIESEDAKKMLRFAPRISKAALRGTFARALSLNHEQACLLINAFVFSSDRSQEVWSQPLVPYQDDYCLVIPCIHSVHLQRIVEGWMRQGGLELDRRGLEFEKFCRKEIAAALNNSPIKKSVSLLNRPVKFKPPSGPEEDIDIVIRVANTILLVEAKCILWPDDSIQFANYRDTIEKAVTQIIRKQKAVQSNYESFVNRIEQLGIPVPDKCNVICCVLTNSAIFSGFPINNVPIVDLSILGRFFSNKHVKAEMRQRGKSVHKHVINFYNDDKNAGEVLEKYLAEPPQLADTKNSVKKREIIFPCENPSFGKLVHELYTVQIDIQDMQSRYGFKNEN